MTAVDLPTEPPAAGPAPPPPLVDTPATRDALDCPLCRYSLRGLAAAENPQCPECGYAFAWTELLRARQHNHPYLFEHHPRRNIRSLLRTLAGGPRPRRFWSSLNAGHAIRPGRLLAYWAVVSLATAVLGFAGAFVANAYTAYYQRVAFLALPSRFNPWTGSFLYHVAKQMFEDNTLELYLVAAAFAWPWMTMATLLIFSTSMRRVRVRPAHVLRCVVYGGDVFVWIGVAFAAIAVLRYYGWLGDRRMWDDTLSARRAVICYTLLLAVAAYRVGVAYRHYLRFDHPWSTVLASQAVVFLFVTTALFTFYEHAWKLVPGF